MSVSLFPKKIISLRLCLSLKIPVLAGLTIGHTADQATLPLGVRATLDADKGQLTIEEAATTA